jgi:hypothetical protein
MTAGDRIPTVRAFTDEQIALDKRTIVRFLERRLGDEKSPIRDAGAIDILSRYHPWEFRSFFLMDSPSIALHRIKQALGYIEGGVDDWFLTAAPEWAYVTETDYPEDGKQFVEHRGAVLSIGPAEFGLVRRDEVHFDGTATEGQVMIEPVDLTTSATETPFEFASFLEDVQTFVPRSIDAASAASDRCRQWLATSSVLEEL